jgi:hypothetical protein
MTKKTDALTKRPTNAQDATDMILAGGEFGGGQLINAAMQRLRSQYGETILAFVTGQMDQMMRLKDQAAILAGHINYIEQRLAAIDAGEFTVSGYPPRINFNDPRLNDGL